jgi:hypothetical protein
MYLKEEKIKARKILHLWNILVSLLSILFQ